MLLRISLLSLGTIAILTIICIILMRLKTWNQLKYFKGYLKAQNFPIIGFFHPQCDGGAGGEKVLYQAIQAIQEDPVFKNSKVLIYSGSKKEPSEILKEVKSRFSIDIKYENLHFVNLDTSDKLKPENYKFLTIVWQGLASIGVCFEALSVAPCDIFIDTMGVGYAYPFVKLFFGPKVITYTHYPIIRYPPVDTTELNRIPLNNVRQNYLVSFAQFRPEKQHDLQLRVWAQALPRLPQDAKFYMIGSVRDQEDQKIVDRLKDLAQQLQISDRISFEINQPRDKILSIFECAKAGIHTMQYEHFGIAICELMASGIITIAHNSEASWLLG
eukprot:403368671